MTPSCGLGSYFFDIKPKLQGPFYRPTFQAIPLPQKEAGFIAQHLKCPQKGKCQGGLGIFSG